MLNALNEYYYCLCSQDNSPIVPKGFSKVAVNYNMVLTKEGVLKNIIPYVDIVVVGKKEREVPKAELFPFRYSISGIAAETIDHREKYNFGMVWDKKESKMICNDSSQKAFAKNKEKNLDFLSDVTSPIINAYKLFLENWIPEKELDNPILMALNSKFENAKFIVTLEYENKPLHQDENMILKWKEFYFSSVNVEKEEKVQCSISGKRFSISEIPRTHTKLKGIKGGQASGVGIVSFNATSFCSYNKEQSLNSYVSNEIMENYTEAFNYLAASSNHKQNLGDITLLFWAMTSNREEAYVKGFNCYMGFENIENLTSDEVEENLATVLGGMTKGIKADWDALELDGTIQFYILGVKPNSSRLSIKLFEHDTFSSFMDKISFHYNDLQMSNEDKQLSLWQIYKELESPVAKTDIAPDLNAKMLQSILKGAPYPRYLLDRIIYRIKVDQDNEKKKFQAINRKRVRIIRACLIRFHMIEREDYKMLNTENLDSAYNCGRLFAILEMIQSSALKGINSTIKDRFFSSACSTPYLVFPRLIKLSQSHLSKLDIGSKIYYEKMIQSVIHNISDTFPKSFNMEKQGMFILGYYQQREELFTEKNKENMEEKVDGIE